MDENLTFAPASDLLRLIAGKQVSPVELTELYFSRIERLDAQLNAYLTLNYNEAITAARSAEAQVVAGEALGPLHGLPISIKDLEITKGIRTTHGSLVFKDRVPDEDSIVVERVRQAGGIILGKTNTPEFGLLATTENRLGDHCRNPWNTDRSAGGSSGGAGAAVIAGLCAVATGSDGGGSIRIPASFCGVYGIKPTQGRVPRYSGAGIPAVANQFSQPGPMTRTVRDSALLLQVLAGYDPRDRTSLRQAAPDFLAAVDRDVKGIRITWSPDYGYSPVDGEVIEVTSKATQVFGELGCSIDDSDLALDSPYDAFWTLFAANAYASYQSVFDNRADQLTEYARVALEQGSNATGAEYAQAIGYLDRLKGQFDDVFERHDLLLSPTMALPAFSVDEKPTRIAGREVDPFWGFLPFTFPINMIGYPAASVPCGFSSDGMPIGLHIVGRPGDEETVIAASAAFEGARPWIQHRPPVS